MAGRRLLKACALIASLSTVIFPLNAWAQSCDAIWGNAVQTHNAPGAVSVGYNAKLVTANPELQVASLLSNSGSTIPSCNTQACVVIRRPVLL